MADLRENDLQKVVSLSEGYVRGVDNRGYSVQIFIDNLFQGYFVDKQTFEGNVDGLRIAGMYYTTGNTLNSINTGLFLVFTSGEAVSQFSINVFNGAIYFRSLLYNDNKWDKWTEWRAL